ncbi:MAG TPA: NADH-quinone oxidoreductase subunit L, partial [Spirochaetia bacterium]|nr:NADH-quinone oxidoreductase subunit L [Spirochaetia bacterium]
MILPVLIPAAAGLLALILPSRERALLPGLIAIAASLAELAVAILLFPLDMTLTLPWMGYGIEFSLVLSRMSAFILLAIAGFGVLVSLYATSFMSGWKRARQFHAWLLITVAMASGMALANNLIVLLVFGEGLLLTQFGMIAAGRNKPYGTAIKAFIIL